jgi:hypothetical protein
MVQKLYSPAHHTTFTQAFRLFVFTSFYLFSLLSSRPLSAQDITGFELVQTLQHPGNYGVGKMDSYFDSTHQLIAYGIEDGSGVRDTLVICDFGRDTMLAKIRGYGALSGISFIDETELLCVMKDTLWRVTGIGESISREVLETGIIAMRLSNDMSTLAFLLYGNGLQYIGMAAYDTATGILQTIDTIGSSDISLNEYTLMAFSPEDDYFAINGGYERAFAEVVDVASRSLHKVVVTGIESTYSPGFFYQGGRLKMALGGGYYNGAIVVIDIATLTQESIMPVFTRYNYALTFDRTGRYLVCGGYDGILGLFEVADTLFTEIELYEVGTLKSLHFTSDNQYLLSGYQAAAGPTLEIKRIIRQPSAVRTVVSMPLILYPNPTTGRVYIEGIRGARVKVYDRSGQLLLTQQNTGDGIDVRTLPSGLYILTAENDRGVNVGRFVKE